MELKILEKKIFTIEIAVEVFISKCMIYTKIGMMIIPPPIPIKLEIIPPNTPTKTSKKYIIMATRKYDYCFYIIGLLYLVCHEKNESHKNS